MTYKRSVMAIVACVLIVATVVMAQSFGPGAFTKLLVKSDASLSDLSDMSAGELRLSGITSCTEVETDGDGDVICGTDDAGTPGGSDTQVQYNSSGSFAGDADFTFDGTDTVQMTKASIGDGTNDLDISYDSGDSRIEIVSPVNIARIVDSTTVIQTLSGGRRGGANLPVFQVEHTGASATTCFKMLDGDEDEEMSFCISPTDGLVIYHGNDSSLPAIVQQQSDPNGPFYNPFGIEVAYQLGTSGKSGFTSQANADTTDYNLLRAGEHDSTHDRVIAGDSNWGAFAIVNDLIVDSDSLTLGDGTDADQTITFDLSTADETFGWEQASTWFDFSDSVAVDGGSGTLHAGTISFTGSGINITDTGAALQINTTGASYPVDVKDALRIGLSPTNSITESHCGNVSMDPPSTAKNATGTATTAVTNLSANAACTCSLRTDFDDDIITKDCYATSGNLNLRFYVDEAASSDPLDAGAQTVDYCCFEK